MTRDSSPATNIESPPEWWHGTSWIHGERSGPGEAACARLAGLVPVSWAETVYLVIRSPAE